MKIGVAAVMAIASSFNPVCAYEGWPANYEGVMLQGFYWDSYSDTKWTTLQSQADELSKYFDLIWIPNSGQCGGYNNMGYMPQYWFTNHNSSFGTEAQLLSMIQTFKSKGTGIIADVVINHRNGVTSWCDFPKENWNGTDWYIGMDGICKNDEAAYNGFNCTGNYDTGDNFDGCRDLDHTNANVQNNCKNYCKCLLEKYGYTGFRLDMVKGYGGQYTKIYNNYAKPAFCVGEYWDGSYDAVANWINATGKSSAAFDFPCKYQLNKAMNGGQNLTELVWKANGTTNQPAGMIHFGYQQFAVTFVDNHDTYRDGSKFTGNVLAANAFILCSPGTPCVFLPHYKANKAAIQKMILARKAAGISNTSSVNVLQSSSNCYMAEIQGSKGKLVVKIGSAMVSPNGYSDSQIVTSGTDYCIWSTVKVGDVPDPNPNPNPDQPAGAGTVYYDNSETAWTTPYVYIWNDTNGTTTELAGKWPGTKMTKYVGDIWSYSYPEKSNRIIFNNGSGQQTEDIEGINDNHAYKSPSVGNGKSIASDMGVYNPGKPARLYLMGHVDASPANHWNCSFGIPMTSEGNTFVARNVTLYAPVSGDVKDPSFSFSTVLSEVSLWDDVNGSHRFGASSFNATALEGENEMRIFAPEVNASSAYSWTIPAGKYNFIVDFSSGHPVLMIAKVQTSGLEEIELMENNKVYFDLMGRRVENPEKGIYIVVKNGAIRKVMIR